MSKLHSIIAPELTDVNFGDNIKEQFGNINDNFQKLSNYDFTKGEKGDSIEIVDVKLNEDKDLKNKIYKTLLNYRSDYVDDKYDEGDDVKFLEAVNYNVRSYLDHEDSTFKYIVQNGEKIGSLPFVYIDERFHHKGISNDVKNTQIYDNEVDLSCIIMYNNGILEVVRNFPNLYYDEDVKALCWEWLGCKTGVTAAGPMGPNGVNTSLLLVKIDPPKKEIETYVCQEIIVNGTICKTIGELKEEVNINNYGGLIGWQAIVIPDGSVDKIYITPIQFAPDIEGEIGDEAFINEVFAVAVSDNNKVDLGFNTDKFWKTIIDSPLGKKGFVLPADASAEPKSWHILHSDSSNNDLILNKTTINESYEVGDIKYEHNNLVIHYNTTIKASDVPNAATTTFDEYGIKVTGNATINKKLTVDGEATINKTLTSKTADVSGLLTAANAKINNDLTVDGNATVNETLTATTATIDNATITNDLTVDGDTFISKTLYTKDAKITNDLTVTKDAKINNDLTVDGNTTVNGLLTAPTLNTNTLTATNEDKTGQLTADNATINNDLTVDGNTTVNGTLAATTLTATTLTATTLTATNEDKTGQLTVDNATVKGQLTAPTLTTTTATVKGQLTAPTLNADKTTVKGQLIANKTLEVKGNLKLQFENDSATFNYPEKGTTTNQMIITYCKWGNIVNATAKVTLIEKDTNGKNTEDPNETSTALKYKTTGSIPKPKIDIYFEIQVISADGIEDVTDAQCGTLYKINTNGALRLVKGYKSYLTKGQSISFTYICQE